MEIPAVQYARSGDVHIAYQVFGDGPDLVFTAGGWNHLFLRWELPVYARLLRRLAQTFRLVLWDKRGTGLSDRHGGIATLDAQLEDINAVLDAVGSERPALLGAADGAALTALFAATFPERTAAAILYGLPPRAAPGDDGIGASPESVAIMRDSASPERLLELFDPETARDPAMLEWWRRNAMMAASPGTVAQMVAMWLKIDLRPVLPAIQVPTTVIQRLDDRIVAPANGRELARLIPGARLVEMPGPFAIWGGDVEALAVEIEEAVTGVRRPVEPDRVLATILFTDIVGSTSIAARMGDTAWRTLLDSHDAVAEREIAAFGGRLVKSTGDGVLATFDSPARAIRCGAELTSSLASRGIEIRAGAHTGECELRGHDVGGIAVHIAARVGALAQPGEVLVTRTVHDLVFGSDLLFADRGEHELRGVPGRWQLLALAR